LAQGLVGPHNLCVPATRSSDTDFTALTLNHMSAASLRILLASALLSVAVVASVSQVKHIEGSSFVQSRVVMGKGVRRVQPLELDEDLDDDSEELDDDNPSLMQAEVCRKKAKSKLQPLDTEEINDEMSMMQTNVVVKRAHLGDGDDSGMEEEDFGIEEEEEQFSAMQTSLTMIVGQRHVGASRTHDEEDEDAFDSASFMQNEALLVSKTEKTDTSCTKFQLEGTIEDDATDVFSLMQADVILNQVRNTGVNEDLDDKVSLAQNEINLRAGNKRSKILAWDTILAMDANTEKDEVKQMVSMFKKEDSAAKTLTSELSQLNDALDIQQLSGPEDEVTAMDRTHSLLLGPD